MSLEISVISISDNVFGVQLLVASHVYFVFSSMMTFYGATVAIQALCRRVQQVTGLTLSSRWPIGVKVCRNSHGGAVRIFYPAQHNDGHSGSKGVGKLDYQPRFFRTSLATVAEGYFHTFAGGFLGAWMRKGGLVFELMAWFVRAICFCLPLSRARIPNCFLDLAPLRALRTSPAPLVLWSHGLTGTSDEHVLMAATLASDGFVVALVHHCDGSSSYTDVEGEDGLSHMFYQHPPMKHKYDVEFRQKQIERRAEEIQGTKKMLIEGDFGKDIAACIDADRCVVGGFSFGAARAAHLAATRPQDFKCCVLWDGWFHIDVWGFRIDIPKKAHEAGIQIPALFIGSAQFQTLRTIADATQRVIDKCPNASSNVVDKSKHQNFCDMVWWVPSRFLKLFGAIGECDHEATYLNILQQTRDFFALHVGKGQ